jgi:hypothetical protein
MSSIIFKIILGIHICCGSLGLICGTIAMIANKTKKTHKTNGLVFFYAMLGIFVSSVYMSIVTNNAFLLLIGFFSFYLAASGYRILFLKELATKGLKPTWVDYILGGSALIVGLLLIVSSVILFTHKNMFGTVTLTFGVLSLLLGYTDFKKFYVPTTNKLFWIANHGGRMGGAYTATITAFLVVNIHIQQNWILWLLPSVIITPIVTKMTNKFIKKITVKNI